MGEQFLEAPWFFGGFFFSIFYDLLLTLLGKGDSNLIISLGVKMPKNVHGKACWHWQMKPV